MNNKIPPPRHCPLPLGGRVGVGLIVACTLAIQQHVVGWVLTHQPASYSPTAAQSPAESPPPSQGAPAPAAGEGRGGGSDRITISDAQTTPDKHSPHTPERSTCM